MGIDVGRENADSGMQFPAAVPQSLMKYDPPIFVGLESSAKATHGDRGDGGRAGYSKAKGDGQGKTSQLDDMVDSMLPPREWTEETGNWMQYVSKEPATRMAVLTLQVRKTRPTTGRVKLGSTR